MGPSPTTIRLSPDAIAYDSGRYLGGPIFRESWTLPRNQLHPPTARVAVKIIRANPWIEWAQLTIWANRHDSYPLDSLPAKYGDKLLEYIQMWVAGQSIVEQDLLDDRQWTPDEKQDPKKKPRRSGKPT